MNINEDLKNVQLKILEIMAFIDKLCRENNIVYYLMGGTALGAVRHGGFIPWDDDLDIFMTPLEYDKFKKVFYSLDNDKFYLQEWKTTEKYLEYSKIRMNGTTFIENNFKNNSELHQGIYVDIMILHKVSNNRLIQRLVYFESKFVTLYGLSQRNWKPKSFAQNVILKSLKILPCKVLDKIFYKRIYKYDYRTQNFKYCYWITPAKFNQGLFDMEFFSNPIDIKFENYVFLGSEKVKEYLKFRYGDYMKLPSEEQQKKAIHAIIYDTQKSYKEYFIDKGGLK